MLSSSTKHEDKIYVSRFYNWKAGSWKDIYTYGAIYKLKADAPEDAVETMARNAVVPMLEKLLADGTIVEYEIDTEAIHTETPGTFSIYYLSPTSEGLDKARDARRDMAKASPFMGAAFDSMTDYTAHRDFLARTNATYK